MNLLEMLVFTLELPYIYLLVKISQQYAPLCKDFSVKLPNSRVFDPIMEHIWLYFDTFKLIWV